MAQTGDVEYGNSNLDTYDIQRAGTGNSKYPNLKSEFSDLPHEKGTLSMARSNDQIVLTVSFLYVLNEHLT